VVPIRGLSKGVKAVNSIHNGTYTNGFYVFADNDNNLITTDKRFKVLNTIELDYLPLEVVVIDT
jgi:hypothetical protein